MRSLKRWSFPLLALLAMIAATVVPSAASDPLPTGMFAIGDVDAVEGAEVTFWGSQWWKENDVSSDQKRPPFKGYARTVDATTCSFTTRTGNSTPPPDPPLGSVITVLVTSEVTQSGSVISGKISGFALISTEGGYDDNPGHWGTGTIIAVQPCVVGGGGGGDL
jgi:hypothetical protein